MIEQDQSTRFVQFLSTENFIAIVFSWGRPMATMIYSMIDVEFEQRRPTLVMQSIYEIQYSSHNKEQIYYFYFHFQLYFQCLSSSQIGSY